MTEYNMSLEEVLKELRTDLREGISQKEAGERLKQEGENVLQGKKQPGILQKFFVQMKDVMVIILIIAAIISFVVALFQPGESYLDSLIIIGIVILNGVLGVLQERKAEKALDALRVMSAPAATVVREGVTAQIPASQLVKGDIVLLEAGNLVPADLRLAESASLQCEESALTGESVPAVKDTDAIVKKNAPLGDRHNMAYSGCYVTYGRGVGVVTATGMDTEMGKIARLLETDGDELTPLQKKLAQMGKYLGYIALGICAVIFVIGLLQGMEPMELFLTAVSLAVAAIPEGLTMVITVVLALGVQRMAGKNAIVKYLPAVETLGSTSVICSDKTGTLTQNRMDVRKVWAVGNKPEDMSQELGSQALHVLRLGAMCSDGRVAMEEGQRVAIGDPTETAIVAAALDNNLEKSQLDQKYPRIGEIPFDSTRKLMTTVHRVGDKFLSVTKGGPDVLLARCLGGDESKARMVNEKMGKDALRVLAVACKELAGIPEEYTPESLEKDLTLIGLIGMMDPPREESVHAVQMCRQAGIKTVMITGDHAATARAIAEEIGILGDSDLVVSGKELSAMSKEELERSADKYAVYARVSPEDKIRIVQAWQARGAVVAMTGDGVNDAPALRAADIGCAMGITGTDVAKEAADMVLTDDNFSTIVEAVREGRGIYDNIKKTIQFLLSSNLGEVFVVFAAILLGWGTPLLPIHLLLVNVVTDALPALSLGLEPVSDGVMRRKPAPQSQGVFSGGLGAAVALQGVMIGVLTLIAYRVGQNVSLSGYHPPSHQVGVTMAFLVLVLSQLSQALNCRSKKSLFEIGFFSSKAMVYSIVFSLALVLVICLVPVLENIFRVVDISMLHWVWVLGLSVAPIPIVELGKLAVKLKQRFI